MYAPQVNNWSEFKLDYFNLFILKAYLQWVVPGLEMKAEWQYNYSGTAKWQAVVMERAGHIILSDHRNDQK